MEHVQKIIYLLSLFLPVMVFFSLGLWFAWMKWFKLSQNFNEAMEEHHELAEKLNTLYLNQTSLSEKHALSPTTVVKEKEPSETEEDSSNTNSESDVHQLKARIKELEDRSEKESAELVSLLKENANLNEKLELIAGANHDDAFSSIDIMEVILNDFGDELVSNDPELGILFQEEPDKVDDLTAIDLLSPKMAASLNELGVYRHRQISLWTYDQFDLFLNKIGVAPNHLMGKNGVWQKHAAILHSKLY